MARTRISKDPRELAHRTADGLEVSLLWSPKTNAVTLVVTDERADERFELSVECDRALEAFYHPFAFAASHGVEYRTAAREPGETVYA